MILQCGNFMSSYLNKLLSSLWDPASVSFLVSLKQIFKLTWYSFCFVVIMWQDLTSRSKVSSPSFHVKGCKLTHANFSHS
jgi:hypothetical protein